MNAKTLIVRELSRSPQLGPEDRLVFERGVNVIVGPRIRVRQSGSECLIISWATTASQKKYSVMTSPRNMNRLESLLNIAGEDVVIERRWREQGVRTKAFVNGEALPIKELWNYIMGKLEIPIVHYPQGIPTAQERGPN
ncbi:MAG: hypothetical protein WKF84_01360 [Pyrinomonadaceae bacterium]